jgi:hypothetical protein
MIPVFGLKKLPSYALMLPAKVEQWQEGILAGNKFFSCGKQAGTT